MPFKLTKEDKEWAKKVKERDGFSCVICKETERLNAHHLIVRENDEARHDILNGLSLCPKHHLFCRTISAHNNPIGLFVWLEAHRPEQLAYCRMKMAEILKNSESP